MRGGPGLGTLGSFEKGFNQRRLKGVDNHDASLSDKEFFSKLELCCEEELLAAVDGKKIWNCATSREVVNFLKHGDRGCCSDCWPLAEMYGEYKGDKRRQPETKLVQQVRGRAHSSFLECCILTAVHMSIAETTATH